MSKLRVSITMSLDGYVAGPSEARKTRWACAGSRCMSGSSRSRRSGRRTDRRAAKSTPAPLWSRSVGPNIGATIMGRNMFGPVRGLWPDESWRGWGGEDPPYHHPVFVLTHHPREPLEMEGGTTFYFVSDGVESALTQAKQAARGREVLLAGGASVVNQYLAAGLVDEIDVSIAPLILGSGARLFEGLDRGTPKLKQIGAIDAPGVTHIDYEVG